MGAPEDVHCNCVTSHIPPLGQSGATAMWLKGNDLWRHCTAWLSTKIELVDTHYSIPCFSDPCITMIIIPNGTGPSGLIKLHSGTGSLFQARIGQIFEETAYWQDWLTNMPHLWMAYCSLMVKQHVALDKKLNVCPVTIGDLFLYLLAILVIAQCRD